MQLLSRAFMRYSDQNMRVKWQVYFDITSLSNPQPLRNPTSINPILKKKLLGCKVEAFLLGLFSIFHQNQAKMIQFYILQSAIPQDWDDVFTISYLLWVRQASQFMQAKFLYYKNSQNTPIIVCTLIFQSLQVVTIVMLSHIRKLQFKV